MKIAVTADVHLSSTKSERLENLDGIIKKLQTKNIYTIVIAGDLFDKGHDGYLDLDRMTSQYKDFSIIAIPGNHDPNLDQRRFNSKNIKIITQPEVHEIGGIFFLFLP